MKSSEEKDISINKKFKKEKIDLREFRKELTNDQFDFIKKILENAYDEKTEIKNSWIISCIELVNKDDDQFIYLPKDLYVERKDDILTFEFQKSKKANFLILLLFIGILLASAIGATFMYTQYLDKVNLNKDIDKDGISDLNVDINNDGVGEINVDTDRDGKPDLNIDYKGNRRATFNLDKNNDGKPDFNLVHDASTPEKRKACDLNCDTNDDGWPDTNIDLDGDGKADVDIDTDKDGVPDINIDINGDGKPDVNIDENNDNKCDVKCINGTDNNSGNNDTPTDDPLANGKHSGSSTLTGDPSINITTGELIVSYSNGTPSTNVLPDDMAEAKKIPDRTFTVENTSAYSITYRLVWDITTNNFATDNLKYKLTSTDGGASTSWQTIAKSNDIVANSITIPGNTIQHYTISFQFKGINAEQNIDQNREFNGIIKADFVG